MIKLFAPARLRELDSYTIREQGITSFDLMERAARAFTDAFCRHWPTPMEVVVLAGPGNNGGDALAVARMLFEKQYPVRVFLFNTTGSLSGDCRRNKEKFEALASEAFTEIKERFEPPRLTRQSIVIDGLFGSGLARPLEGGFATLVKMVNDSPSPVVSIDIPSGLTTEGQYASEHTPHIQAAYTFTFQMPKQAMLLPDAAQSMGKVEVLDIGLSAGKMEETPTDTMMFTTEDLSKILLPRSPFGHKGTFGKALLIAGKYGMAGASILAARACLRSGVGKIVVRTPQMNSAILQISVPEAVLSPDPSDMIFSSALPAKDYDAVAVGPGLGTDVATQTAFFDQLVKTPCPLVIDADGLNILGARRELMGRLPRHAVLTPHPAELQRLHRVADTSDYAVLQAARELAMERSTYVILKGHHTAVCTPEGKTFFNTTGNSGMGTAGCGDVLTGILLALLSEHYSPLDACLLAVGLHGLAGDIAANRMGEDGIIASDIVDALPLAFKQVRRNAPDQLS